MRMSFIARITTVFDMLVRAIVLDIDRILYRAHFLSEMIRDYVTIKNKR